MQTTLEIDITEKGKYKVLKLKGRIDANWAPRLADALNGAIRNGSYDIILDAENVDYISSAGVRVLLMAYRQLKKLDGTFGISRASDEVKAVASTMGISELFTDFTIAGGECETSGPGAGEIDVKVLYTNGNAVKAIISGDVNKIKDFSYAQKDVHGFSVGPKTLALGLGALGPGGDEALSRAGEFLAVGGTAVYMPSDGSKRPDFLTSGPDFSPKVNCLYSIRAECEYSAAFTFKARQKRGIKLSELVGKAHEVAGCDDLMMAAIGETGGIIGAALAVAPCSAGGRDPFGFPGARDAFNVAVEPVFAGHLAVAAGVSSLGDGGGAAKLMRRLGREAGLKGHFHAAVFSYSPQKNSCSDPSEPVGALYANYSPDAVFHLMNDRREFSGAGETEFVSGTCWVVRVSSYLFENVEGGL